MTPSDQDAPRSGPTPDRDLDDILTRIDALRNETRARIAALGAAPTGTAAPAAAPTAPPAPAPAPVRVVPATPAPVPAAPVPAAVAPAPTAPPRRARPARPARPRTVRSSVRRSVGRSVRDVLAVRAAGLRRGASDLAANLVAVLGDLLRRMVLASHRTVLAVRGRTAAVAAAAAAGLRARAGGAVARARATASRGGVAARRAGGSATAALRGLATTVGAAAAAVAAAVPAAALAAARGLRAAAARVPLRPAAAGIAIVGLGAAVTLVLGAAAESPSDVGDTTAPAPTAEAASTPVAEVPAADEPVAPIVPPTAPTGPREPEPIPEVAPTEPAPPPAPVRRPPAALRIPAIGVEAETVPVGLEPDGAMEIPSDVSTIGWYEPGEGVGVAPGQVGTAVLAGHVDSRTQGAGAFYYLRDLAVGDEVVVDHADGSSSTWRVTEVIQYAKDELPIDEVFVWDGPPRLALITCGGAFDWTVRSYTDNIVVHAEPVTAAADAPTSVPS